MSIAREDIMTALLTQLSSAGQFETFGRRVLPWQQVKAQPALFVRNTKEHWPAPATRGLPRKVVMDCEVWIYARTEDPDGEPAATLNDLLGAVEDALAPSVMDGVQTLNGACQHCWIEGDPLLYPGDLDAQAIAVIPLKILVTA